MVNEFMLWFKANEQRLRSSPTLAKIKRSEVKDETLHGDSTLHKANVSFETKDVLASFTVWREGMLEIIIMNNQTGEEIVIDDRRLQIPEEMLPVLDHYCNLIVNGAALQQL